jgi:hypothetical protein
MKRKISVDLDRRLYLIPFDLGRRRSGFTCLGFEHAFQKATAIARWLQERGVQPAFPEFRNVGTPRGFADFRRTVEAARQHFNKTKERCPVDLTPQLIGLEGKRVEIVDCYGDRRRFYVGKSTGWIPCHLEIPRRDSSGGFPVTGSPFKSLKVIENKSRP